MWCAFSGPCAALAFLPPHFIATERPRRLPVGESLNERTVETKYLREARRAFPRKLAPAVFFTSVYIPEGKIEANSEKSVLGRANITSDFRR